MQSPNYTDASTIISLMPIPLSETKPGLQPGVYTIKAVRNPMKDYELLHVMRGKFPVYIDENRPALIVPSPSDVIAESICRDYKVSVMNYQPGIAEPGLFWVKEAWTKKEIDSGSSPAIDKEMERARTMQTRWFKALVDEADDVWGKYKMRRMISDIQRLASVALGLEKEWNIDTMVERALSVCKFCRSQIANEAIVCPNCHGVLDIARFKNEFRSASDVLASPQK